MIASFTLLGGIGVFGLLIALIVLAAAVALVWFEIAMFVSAVQNRFITSEVKALWLIGMLLIHPFVAIAYYFTDYRRII